MIRLLPALLAVTTLWGCAYHWQTREPVPTRTYEAPKHRSPESLGKLRRLALLPVEFQTYDENRSGFRQTLQKECAEYLVEKKGYDVTLLGNSAGADQKDEPIDADDTSEGDLAKRWREAKTSEDKAAVIREIGGAVGVDDKSLQFSSVHEWLRVVLLG